MEDLYICIILEDSSASRDSLNLYIKRSCSLLAGGRISTLPTFPLSAENPLMHIIVLTEIIAQLKSRRLFIFSKLVNSLLFVSLRLICLCSANAAFVQKVKDLSDVTPNNLYS